MYKRQEYFLSADGVRYRSLAHVARALGIERIEESHASTQEITPAPEHTRRLHDLLRQNGVETEGWRAVSKPRGVPPSGSKPPGQPQRASDEYFLSADGVRYRSLAQVARALGFGDKAHPLISTQTARQNKRRRCGPRDEATDSPSEVLAVEVTTTEALEHLGVSLDVVECEAEIMPTV